jgi:hypothetical protein
MDRDQTIAALAEAFTKSLRDDLDDKQFAEIVMRHRNAPVQYRDACASHEFLDANMNMDAAFKAVLGREVDPDEDATLWNEAWAKAKASWPALVASSLESDEISADRVAAEPEPALPRFVIEIEVKVVDATAVMDAAARRAMRDGILLSEWLKTREDEGAGPQGADLQMLLDPGLSRHGYEIEECRVRSLDQI